jgi:hypothetical protein
MCIPEPQVLIDASQIEREEEAKLMNAKKNSRNRSEIVLDLSLSS